MLCQKCHKNRASVRYAEVVDGKVKNLQLCKECLARQQDEVENGFEFAEPVLAGRAAPHRGPLVDTETDTRTCEACETTLKSILETGKVGCCTCYKTFAVELESLLEGIHDGLTHRGKTPHLDDTRARIRSDLQTKRALLKTALGLENYEEAAGLRDEIRALEAGLGLSSAGVE